MSTSADKLVAVYIKIRDAKAQLEEDILRLSGQQDAIGQALLEICKATGQDGGKTAHGSFTRRVDTRYETTNWEKFYEFIAKQPDGVRMLEQRIHQGNFKEFLKANPDVLPVGMNVLSKYAVTVRRATT